MPAIREFLLNAIVHRDYNNPTDTIIKIFDEDIEITNPGKLMGDLTIEKIKSGNYVSIHRNKLLTEAFYLTGDIEKYGTGFRRVNSWFTDYSNIKYELLELKGFIQLRITTQNVLLNVPLNKRQKEIVYLIKNNSYITLFDMSDKYSVNRETIKRDLVKLQKLNIIKRIGSRKTGHWLIIEKPNLDKPEPNRKI